uniref:Uncharacterized protein n=1 Tax=Heterorhabditis bacteriophora TaxID=37862 RepID=A0A1I7XBA1_HETBA
MECAVDDVRMPLKLDNFTLRLRTTDFRKQIRPSGGYSCTINLHYRLDITSDLLRLFKGCTVEVLWLMEVRMSSDVNHLLYLFSITKLPNSFSFLQNKVLLNASLTDAFLRFASLRICVRLISETVLQLKSLSVGADCDFSDDELFAGKYSGGFYSQYGIALTDWCQWFYLKYIN